MFIISGIFKLFGDLCGLVGPLSISYIVAFVNLQLSSVKPATASGATADGDATTAALRLNTTRCNESGSNDATMIKYPSWSEFSSNGWIMSCIVLIAFLLQGTFSQASTNLINMEGIKIKNALQGIIYRKTLSLSASCFYTTSRAAGAAGSAKETNDDCDLNDPGTITNLSSEDSLNIMTFFWICHYVWSIPLKVNAHSPTRPVFSRTITVINTFPDRHRRLLSLPQTRHELFNWICGDNPNDATSTVPRRTTDVKEF